MGGVRADADEDELSGAGVAQFVEAGADGGVEELAFARVGEGAPSGPGVHGAECR